VNLQIVTTIQNFGFSNIFMLLKEVTIAAFDWSQCLLCCIIMYYYVF